MKPFQFVPWHYHRPPRTYFESWLRFHPVVGHGDEDEAVAAEVFKMGMSYTKLVHELCLLST